MVFAKAHCYNCGADFEIYTDDVSTDSRAALVSCPHCCAIMPPKAAAKLYNAFLTFEEVNKTLRVAHSDKGAHLFQLELHNHYVPESVFNRGLDDDNSELSEQELRDWGILDGLDMGLDDLGI